MARHGNRSRNAVLGGITLITGLLVYCILVRLFQMLSEVSPQHFEYLLFAAVIAALVFVWLRIFTPHSTTRQVRLVTYNVGSPEMADDIVVRWMQPASNMTVSSWTLLQDASPVRFKGKVQSYPTARGWVISIEASYGLFRKGTLTCKVSTLPNNRIMLEYHWDGAEQAMHNTTSDDYKLLNYLMEIIETEFKARGCHVPGANFSSSRTQSGGTGRVRSKVEEAWWRSFQQGGEADLAAAGSWPSPQDFSEAIQNPPISMIDPDLKQSVPMLNSLGLPHVASGAFASVFKLSDGDKHWAVRCFNARPTDQHERYKAISSFVLADDLSYTVDFNYLTDGIKHNGASFPILKMNWVKGEPLEAYIRSHLHDRAKLERLRAEFWIMLRELRKNGIAHGDLQHGNILVEHDSLYLVDYDGMYVPELAGRQSNELGHRNYQHPGRKAQHFGPYLDNFAGWLIDTTLLCLIEDPALWQRFSGGDECLLFRQQDLADPNNSELFAALRSHESASIRKSTERLLQYLALPLEQVPYLDAEPVEDAEPVKIVLPIEERQRDLA